MELELQIKKYVTSPFGEKKFSEISSFNFYKVFIKKNMVFLTLNIDFYKHV